MALQAPLHFFGACGNPEVMKLIWDSGVSISISTPNKDGFVGEVKPVPITTSLKGLAKGLEIAGMGTVHWNVLDNSGHLCTLKILALLRMRSTSDWRYVLKLHLHSPSTVGVSVTDTYKVTALHVIYENNPDLRL